MVSTGFGFKIPAFIGLLVYFSSLNFLILVPFFSLNEITCTFFLTSLYKRFAMDTFFKALLDISREIALEIYEKKKPEFSD